MYCPDCNAEMVLMIYSSFCPKCEDKEEKVSVKKDDIELWQSDYFKPRLIIKAGTDCGFWDEKYSSISTINTIKWKIVSGHHRIDLGVAIGGSSCNYWNVVATGDMNVVLEPI